MAEPREVESVFAPQDGGGYHGYAPGLPGLHTQGETLEIAVENAREALALYIAGVREGGGSIGTGIMRRRLPIPR